jgi:H+-transporting ATPase
VLPLFDPPRDDAKATVATALKMGVKVKMVTGDQLAIAQETAKKLGMGTNILDASSLGDLKQNAPDAVIDSIESADGFAQVFPEHKFHIVDDLQKRGHIVGMTGDGVNDAPALKKADCGIAVSGATDAARAAASIVLMTPGLSVIIDAIKESRKIFQRMNSYAIYRIAETLRVLFFMTLAILIFNFYPVTAVMIVMLALLNDGAILSIAYDNVHYKDQPEAWNMRVVLGISTVLGVIGVVAAFGLFYLAERVFHFDRAHAQTMMYLKLSVAGHLTIFLTRTRGPFWSIRPAPILWLAVLGTQIVATMFAVYGFLMTPLGWRWALFVWGYALAWFLVNDRVKLLAYRLFDPAIAKAKTKAKAEVPHEAEAVEPNVEARPGGNPVAESATTTGQKPQVNMESKSEAKAAPKPANKNDPLADLSAQIAQRAYKLYEERGRKDGAAVKDWEKAESEVRADLAKAGSACKSKLEPLPQGTVESKPEAKHPLQSAAKNGSQSEPKAPKSEIKIEPKTDAPPKIASDVPPQLVKRVHERHEKLGREDVGAVEEWDRAKTQQ